MGANREVQVRTRQSRGLLAAVFVLVVMAGVCFVAGLAAQTLVTFRIIARGPNAVQVEVLGTRNRPTIIHRDGQAFMVFIASHHGVHAFSVLSIVQARNLTAEQARKAPSWVLLRPQERGRHWTTIGFGWPWPSLFGVSGAPDGPRAWPPKVTWWQKNLGLDRHQLQTLQPIPLNTFANSAFYGVIVAGMWFIGTKARRAWRRRVRPGTCTHCGYALAGLPAVAPCPECGRER